MSGQATSPSVTVKAIAEVELRDGAGGQGAVRLRPAERAVPGDQLIYTLEVRNPGMVTIPAPEVVYAIPAHMTYLADSAAGPGAEVSYSVDSGATFDRPEYLRAAGADGVLRIAFPSEYTHIRWKFKHSLRPKSVAFARFRVQVK
jgi:uncharacterized repeat protein (TIGR01451 family)